MVTLHGHNSTLGLLVENIQINLVFDDPCLSLQSMNKHVDGGVGVTHLEFGRISAAVDTEGEVPLQLGGLLILENQLLQLLSIWTKQGSRIHKLKFLSSLLQLLLPLAMPQKVLLRTVHCPYTGCIYL